MVLGASETFKSINNCRRNLVFCIIARLVAVPALCLTAHRCSAFVELTLYQLIGLFLLALCSIFVYNVATDGSDYELSVQL
jgi:hypothetical protein